MPLDTCITNVGEYYSSHYLDSTFAKDVKSLVATWNDQGSQSPPRRLQNLSQHYFRAKTQALDEEEPIRRQFAGDEVRGWHAHLLQSLGYTELSRFDHPVEGGDTFVPARGRVNRYNKSWLVVCEAHFCLPEGSLKEGMPSEDPLEMEPYKDQLQNQADHKLCEGDWSRCVGRIFTEEDAPRWILLLAGSRLLLLDRNTYTQGRFLSFDLDDAFGRKEKDTFNHIAAFLSAETLCPDGESDEVLLDKLEEQSHKFAHGVTESLQFAVREAIELLVNEWARDRTEREKRPLLKISRDELKTNGQPLRINLPEMDDRTYEITAEHLRREALTFVYRLLFCFYAEARGGELEILPVDDNIYRLGYSLESLRDLELVPLTEATGAGTYFHQYLKQLFQIIHNGFNPNADAGLFDPGDDTNYRNQETVRAFYVRPLTATLFSPDATPLLNRAQLSNRCLQTVIRNLSLSKDNKSKTIGRVNYAELGINQLGAVYEGLLSYKGMFADQELIHVKAAERSFGDKKTPTWFVPRERIDEFKKDEVERLPDGKPRIYRKGEFILHLNGIDREQSASYYTPEVLTKCLVEEALRELLKDYTPDDADKILSLKICEPAMGSGAFLNEAAEQLATRYLELKQKQLQEKYPDGEVPLSDLRILASAAESQNVSAAIVEPDAVAVAGVVPEPVSGGSSSATMLVAEKTLAWDAGTVSTTIEPARFGDELRRVKHYIATNNIYGVDLNETAVELGQLSLWLGSIHRLLVHESETGGRDIYQSGATPWFGLRLRCGNSLIGARRAVWTASQLKRGEHAWTSKRIQEVQAAVERLQQHTTPEQLGEFKRDALRLFTKIKWSEMEADAEACREQVIRFAQSARDRNPNGLNREEKKLFEKRQTTWKWISTQRDQETLLAMFDLLPGGGLRTVDQEAIEWFLENDERSHAKPASREGEPDQNLSATVPLREPLKPGLPRLLKSGESRGDDEVYHFLVFDPDMVPTRSDQLMRSFWKDDCNAAGEWVKKQVSPKWKQEEINEAFAVCDLVDQHWRVYAHERAAALDATACTATVWPIPSNSPEAVKSGPTLAEQERVCRELESTSGSFQRLRLVMDTWCSLWFWPLGRVSDLPSRDALLASARLLLSGDRPDRHSTELLTARLGFEIEVLLRAALEGEVPDTELVAGAVPWFAVAETICGEQNFHHWELAFVEMLGAESKQDGFDLVLGNPPWLRFDWKPTTALAEIDAASGVKGVETSAVPALTNLLNRSSSQFKFFSNVYRRIEGEISNISSSRLNPTLSGIRPNLYKVFIVRSWELLNKSGTSGLLHPEGPYEDTKNAKLRVECYKRLRSHLQFKNEMLLFSDVGNKQVFSVNVYGAKRKSPRFISISNLFHPSTVHNSLSANECSAPAPSIKDDNDRWNIAAHSSRVIHVDESILTNLALLSGDTDRLAVTFPQLHSRQLLKVLSAYAHASRLLNSAKSEYTLETFFNETNAQRSGAIAKQTSPTFEPELPDEWILLGSHFNVMNPLNKTARSTCTSNKQYDFICLDSLSAVYLPRSVFRPGNAKGSRTEFESQLKVWPRKSTRKASAYYMVCFRAQCQPGNERSLICAIVPPGVTGVHAVKFFISTDIALIVHLAGIAASLPADFLLRFRGRSGVSLGDLMLLPSVPKQFEAAMAARTLRLNCLTEAYEGIWKLVCPKTISIDDWTAVDPRLKNNFDFPWAKLSCDIWLYGYPLRSDFARRQAVIEIDVLVAISLELTLGDLQSIYRIQFPVMRGYERRDVYDCFGACVPNPRRPDNQGGKIAKDAFEAVNCYPAAFRIRPAADALSPDWPFADETSIPLDQAHRVPGLPEFDSIRRYVAAVKELGDQIATAESEETTTDGPPPADFTASRIRQLESVYGQGRVPLMLDVSWDIDDGLQTVTKTFFPPFTKVDREADYARAWKVFEERYGKGGVE